MVKNLSAMKETPVQSMGWEDPLEKETATPVFLPGEFHGQRSLAGYSLSMGSQRVRFNLATKPETVITM